MAIYEIRKDQNAMKRYAKGAVRTIWRNMLKPVIRLLPARHSNRIETLIHYVKLTLVHGQVINFRPAETDQNRTAAIQLANLPTVVDNPSCKEAARALPAQSGPLPHWAIAEMRALSEIEAELFPSAELIGRMVEYVMPVRIEPGEVYAECHRKLREVSPDLIIVVPWLKRGGADQGVLHHAKAAVRYGKRVLVIATLDSDSPWAARLAENTGFISLGEVGRALTQDERQVVLLRLLLQSGASTLHIVNSELGWNVVRDHGKSLREVGMKLFASVFCDDFDEQGVRWSYARFYFPTCFQYLDGVFCDTKVYPADLVERYGVAREKIHTLYFPRVTHDGYSYRGVPGGRVLWAGRFSRQKRVDLLLAIAKQMRETEFVVYGYASNPYEKALEKSLLCLPNVTVRSSYEALEEVISVDNYAAFLYTSAWDGLPNVILDATACGLAVIASDVGGVGEFINESTGYLVSDADNPDAYVASLHRALQRPEDTRSRWECAIDLLRRRHNETGFAEHVAVIEGYLD